MTKPIKSTGSNFTTSSTYQTFATGESSSGSLSSLSNNAIFAYNTAINNPEVSDQSASETTRLIKPDHIVIDMPPAEVLDAIQLSIPLSTDPCVLSLYNTINAHFLVLDKAFKHKPKETLDATTKFVLNTANKFLNIIIDITNNLIVADLNEEQLNSNIIELRKIKILINEYHAKNSYAGKLENWINKIALYSGITAGIGAIPFNLETIRNTWNLLNTFIVANFKNFDKYMTTANSSISLVAFSTNFFGKHAVSKDRLTQLGVANCLLAIVSASKNLAKYRIENPKRYSINNNNLADSVDINKSQSYLGDEMVKSQNKLTAQSSLKFNAGNIESLVLQSNKITRFEEKLDQQFNEMESLRKTLTQQSDKIASLEKLLNDLQRCDKEKNEIIIQQNIKIEEQGVAIKEIIKKLQENKLME